MLHKQGYVQDCHQVSWESQVLCIHYTLSPNHTLIPSYYHTIVLGIPMAILVDDNTASTGEGRVRTHVNVRLPVYTVEPL